MAMTVSQVIDAFDLLYKSLHDKEFRKSLRMHEMSERELLPLVRTFLLGYFGESLVAEPSAVLPGSLSGNGRIDFMIGNVAVEFALRRPEHVKRELCAGANETEVKKLLKHKGPAVMILFDMARDSHLTDEDLNGYRALPSLGRGKSHQVGFQRCVFRPETEADRANTSRRIFWRKEAPTSSASPTCLHSLMLRKGINATGRTGCSPRIVVPH